MAAQKAQEIQITEPNLQYVKVRIRGSAPYVQHKFSAKATKQIMETQKQGSQSRSKKKREARDFDADYREAMHKSDDGWHGIPAPALRSAMIDSCRLVGFVMTHAKLSLFIEPDGFDVEDASPLVKIRKGRPKKHIGPVRLATGVIDIRSRPMWAPGWEADINIQFDADQFSPSDVINLLNRAGRQVGIGEGRPSSKKSHGCGWGTFDIVAEKEKAA